MTKDQIIALEWATATLMNLNADHGTTAWDDHITELAHLLDAAKMDQLSLDASKASFVAFMAKHDVTVPMAEFDSWRMCPIAEQRRGEINGLPESHGVLRATNGILCFIERPNGSLFEGHLQFFIPDPRDAIVRINHDGTPKRAPKQVETSEVDLYLSML